LQKILNLSKLYFYNENNNYYSKFLKESGLMKVKLIAAFTGLSLISAPATANDEFIGGLMGAMIGAAITSQGNSNTNNRRSHSKPKVSSATRQKNKEIQEALNYFGFSAGVPDGVLGRKSRTAMSQMQACINRPITGKLDAFEEQFLKNSFFKAQAGGNETLRLVASKPNGYCGVLQHYHQELVQPTAKAVVAQQNTTPAVQQNTTAAAQQNTTVVLNQQNTQNNSTITNNTLVVIDSELQTKFDLMVAQLKLLEQIQTHIDAKAVDESSTRKLTTVIKRIEQLRSTIRKVKKETNGKYGTPIKPTNANLGVTAVKASEVFPRVPYYIPGTDETGEMWVKPM
jgi:ribosomal protein S15P/S13E